MFFKVQLVLVSDAQGGWHRELQAVYALDSIGDVIFMAFNSRNQGTSIWSELINHHMGVVLLIDSCGYINILLLTT